jgi:membrane protease YdiL (CAAX protease family)
MAEEQHRSDGSMRRYGEVVSCVAAWMGLGWLLRLDVNQYLLLGVPITLLFQLLVRRQPLRALWVREAPAFRLGWRGATAAAALALVPLLGTAWALARLDWAGGAYGLCAILGAVGAAYALRHFRRGSLRPLMSCLLTGLVLALIQWTVMLGRHYVEIREVEGGVPLRVGVGLVSLFQYFPVVFVLEEVSFRMLDGHLYQGVGRQGVPAGLFVSALWGLWHLPIAGSADWATVGWLLFVCVPLGLSLSWYWRRSGNLTVPALSHALWDAIRDGII